MRNWGRIDVIAIQLGNPGMHPNREIYHEVAEAIKTCPIPVIPTLSSVSTCTRQIREFTGQGNFYFVDEVNCAFALGRVLKRPLIFDASHDIPGYDRDGIAGMLEGKGGVLSADTVTRILEKAGFTFPQQMIAASLDEAKNACDAIGYPAALKVIGPLHKSDVGGVRLGIGNAAEAGEAWHDLMAIRGAEGVTVQRMIEGTEVILGSSHSGDIGHLVMFGLGGIYTEVLKDVSFALAPLADEECRRMIRSIRAYRILEGVRGQKGLSTDTLSLNLARLSRLVSDFPAIQEIDINPLKGTGDELYVVDARMIMKVPGNR